MILLLVGVPLVWIGVHAFALAFLLGMPWFDRPADLPWLLGIFMALLGYGGIAAVIVGIAAVAASLAWFAWRLVRRVGVAIRA